MLNLKLKKRSNHKLIYIAGFHGGVNWRKMLDFLSVSLYQKVLLLCYYFSMFWGFRVFSKLLLLVCSSYNECQVRQVRYQGDLILYQWKHILIFSNSCFSFEMFSLIVQNFLWININLSSMPCNPHKNWTYVNHINVRNALQTK